jgi:hypothetical protein
MANLDGFVNLLPPNTYKFKHHIIVEVLPDFSKVFTRFAVINNGTNDLIAFVDLKWQQEEHTR